MSSSSPLELMPFRLSHQADFPGSIVVPDWTVARFNSRVLRGGPNDCWPYQFLPLRYADRGACKSALQINLAQYFNISWTLRPYRLRQVIPAHRLALLQAVGPDALKGRYANHLCTAKSCMNPAHLYPGTGKQNAADRVLMEAIQRHRGSTDGVVLPRHPRSRIMCEALINGTDAARSQKTDPVDA